MTALRACVLPPRGQFRDDPGRAHRPVRAGAMQVACNGDLANWSTGEPDASHACGSAMDLVAGVKSVYVITQHCTKSGEPKLVSGARTR